MPWQHMAVDYAFRARDHAHAETKLDLQPQSYSRSVHALLNAMPLWTYPFALAQGLAQLQEYGLEPLFRSRRFDVFAAAGRHLEKIERVHIDG
jgi:hypothetical protein